MKGQLNVATPKQYLAALEEPRRSDLAKLDQLIRKAAPKLEPVIYGGMLGFGPYHYTYPSGREGDGAQISLASNKSTISLYVCAVDARGWIAERYKSKLPKAKSSRNSRTSI